MEHRELNGVSLDWHGDLIFVENTPGVMGVTQMWQLLETRPLEINLSCWRTDLTVAMYPVFWIVKFNQNLCFSCNVGYIEEREINLTIHGCFNILGCLLIATWRCDWTVAVYTVRWLVEFNQQLQFSFNEVYAYLCHPGWWWNNKIIIMYYVFTVSLLYRQTFTFFFLLVKE